MYCDNRCNWLLKAAAIFYAFLSRREAGVEELWVVVSLVICTSVLTHGFTATPLAKLLELTHALRILGVLGVLAVDCGTPLRVYDKLSLGAIFA
jgi:hypothetical protein